MNADKKIRVHPPNGRSIVLTRLNLLLYTEGYGASTRHQATPSTCGAA